jgi:23S rRNA (uracil1939-C5)-methyltransferase
VSVRILRLATGGDGVGKLEDGRTVFVPRTAPGDLVTLHRLRPAKRFVRAWVDQILEPSPERTEPRCPHYVADECGGCQLQHMTYEAQLAARRSFVGDALRRLAHRDVPDPPIEPADRPFDYRAKLTLHADATNRRIGLHRYGRPGELFDLAWCHITEPALMELWQAVRPHRRLLPAGLEQIVLRLDREGGRHLVAKVHGTEVWTRAAELSRALATAGQTATLWWHPEGGVPRVVAGGARGGGGTPHVGVFEQVNPGMGDRVRRFVVERLGAVAGTHAWDLYAGIGETTAWLAAAGATVESVELNARAVAHAEATGPAAGRHAGRAEDVVARLRAPDLVVTNPPRTGMDERVVAEIARRAPARIAYLSCDPATLARDLVRLGPRYRLAEVRAFDLFPQTAHVETVVLLERA